MDIIWRRGPGFMKWVASRALKTGTEPAFLMDKGSRFQSRIVLGKIDCCLEAVLAYGTTYELVLAERDCF